MASKDKSAAMDTDAQEKPANGTSEENDKMDTTTEEKPAEPSKLLKGKAHFYYNMNHALRMVILKPVAIDDLSAPEILKWTQKASHYQFTMDKGACEAVLYYKTMLEGDEAFADLRSCVDNGDTTRVCHPSFPPNISAWQFWSQLKSVSTLAEAPLTSEEGKQETLFDRQIILENVPESVTHEELYEQFPDVPSILIYPHEPACKGLTMLEFAELEAAKNFVKNHRGKLKIGENDIKVTIFTSRLSAWESTKTPAKMMDPDVSYEDDERVALCEQLQQLENEKEQIINREDLLGDEKIREHFQVHEKIKPIQAGLKMDTNRRKLKNLGFPEPAEIQNRYTKFAQSKGFSDKVVRKLKSPPGKARGASNQGGYKRGGQGAYSAFRGRGGQMGGGYRNVGSGGRYGGGYDSGQYGDGGGFGPGMGQRGFRSYESSHISQMIEGIADALQNNMLAMGGGSGGGQMRRGGFSGGRSRGGMW